MKMYLAMQRELVVVEQAGEGWQAHTFLEGLQPTCLAVDPFRSEIVYCGTFWARTLAK